ncbi:hypothetical protein [Bryobacter aggregatus]|uniref:hypothetical protein n=1 Tax=Bryobacter aggregatus TaxID=360054 RepID=UPI00056C20B8|nr:hypothetical protein [Bryobacter aggregatus]
MSESRLWLGIRYVDANPVRAAMVERVEEYRWSSAAVHLGSAEDRSGGFWRDAGGATQWKELPSAPDRAAETHLLRRCTYAGRPFGEEVFVERMEMAFQRKWRRWSFEKALGGRTLSAS